MSQPTRLFVAIALLTLGITCPSLPIRAQDKKSEAAKQKEVVLANLKKADLNKIAIVETENFFVVGNLSEEKAKTLGALLEKIVPLSRKALQFEPKEEAWKGKLAVYYLVEGKDYKNFFRNVLMSRPEGIYYDVRSDAPFVVDPVDVPGKATEADQFASTAAIVAGAYLKARASSASIPEWLRSGFGRITALRAEGLNSNRYQSYKKQAKALASGAKTGAPADIADLWAESKAPNADLLAASVVEYMAYGPGAASFQKLIYGFRPDENGNTPSTAQALEAADWKDAAKLEKDWRKWVATGKP